MLRKAIKVIRSMWRWWRAMKRVIPREIREVVIAYVIKATRDASLDSGKKRREWVIHQLMAKHRISESRARLLVEMAVLVYKAIKK
jgi:hypothetical protein